MTANSQPDASPGRRSEISAALSACLPSQAVLSAREDLLPYECDGLSAYRQTPLVAALPATVAEAAEVLRVARETGTPVVARGSGTGLSGGALPLADGILLSLGKFNRILAVDPLARVARVQP
ncbi:MAG: FAD-binding protein, partial [Betaproteobacteria bacterium]|nr:FAD-binding protein [Betaproteobacteria bacterium]